MNGSNGASEAFSRVEANQIEEKDLPTLPLRANLRLVIQGEQLSLAFPKRTSEQITAQVISQAQNRMLVESRKDFEASMSKINASLQDEAAVQQLSLKRTPEHIKESVITKDRERMKQFRELEIQTVRSRIEELRGNIIQN